MSVRNPLCRSRPFVWWKSARFCAGWGGGALDPDFSWLVFYDPIPESNQIPQRCAVLPSPFSTQLTAPFYSILFETTICQFNSSKVSPVMSGEVREHLTRDQRPFLHPESLQTLQIPSSMTVLLLFRRFLCCFLGLCLNYCMVGRFKHGPL